MFPKPKIDGTTLKEGQKIQVFRFQFFYYPDSKQERLDFFDLSMRSTKCTIKFESKNKIDSFSISRINWFYFRPEKKYDKTMEKYFSIYFVCLSKHLKEYLDKADGIMKSYGIKLLEEDL